MPEVTLTDHSGPVYDVLKFNDEILISGSGDKTVRVWQTFNDVAKPLVLYGHLADVNTLCDVSEEEFASGSSDHSIRVWKLGNGGTNF